MKAMGRNPGFVVDRREGPGFRFAASRLLATQSEPIRIHRQYVVFISAASFSLWTFKRWRCSRNQYFVRRRNIRTRSGLGCVRYTRNIQTDRETASHRRSGAIR